MSYKFYSGHTFNGIENRVSKRCSYTHIHSSMLHNNSQTVEATKRPLMDEWINKMWYKHTTEN